MFTGETWQQKIWQFPDTESVRGQLAAYNADALVVTKLDEIACKINDKDNNYFIFIASFHENHSSD